VRRSRNTHDNSQLSERGTDTPRNKFTDTRLGWRPKRFPHRDCVHIRLAVRDGSLRCAQPVDVDWIARLSLPPRRGRLEHGVLFYANRVLHAGEDDKHGYFVAGFGRKAPCAA
jgi:hypothetical protein